MCRYLNYDTIHIMFIIEIFKPVNEDVMNFIKVFYRKYYINI